MASGPTPPITPEVCDRVRLLAGEGLSQVGIAAKIGRSPRGFRDWIKAGRDAAEKREAGADLTEREELYLSLVMALWEGEAAAEEVHVDRLGTKYSNGSIFYLERRRSSEWAKARDKDEFVNRELLAAEKSAEAFDLNDKDAVIAVLRQLPPEVLREALKPVEKP